LILSNEGIRKALEEGQIVIDPSPNEYQFTTSAVDLTLGDQFFEWDKRRYPEGVKVDLDLSKQDFNRTAEGYLSRASLERDGSFLLAPHEFVLGITREKVLLRTSSLLAARVEGRSSLARLGLIVHLTAPTIHAGFSGHIALEMVNMGHFHLRLVPFKTQVCQLIFECLQSCPTGEVNTAFVGQVDPSGAKST
jgi:dCTP deaminase